MFEKVIQYLVVYTLSNDQSRTIHTTPVDVEVAKNANDTSLRIMKAVAERKSELTNIPITWRDINIQCVCKLN